MFKIKKIKINRRFLCIVSCHIFFSTLTFSQKVLTIEDCYALTETNYPLIKQMALIEKSAQYNLDNASKGFLPQLTVNAQATYQSDVTKIPISIPGITIPTPSKDQYKIYGEVYQSLTDKKGINQQKELIKNNVETEKQKIEIELYKLMERINQLYFGLLLIDAQIEQTNLLKKDIQSSIEKTNAAIKNGTATKTNSDLLLAESLKADQRIIELKATRTAYADMLSIFIKQPVNETTSLQSPVALNNTDIINRPELKLYDLQKKTIDIQMQQIDNRKTPKIGLFVQAGYGRPTLNVLNNDFSFYGIGGLKANWNLSSLYTSKNDKALLAINQNSIDVQKETFLLNINLTLKQQDSEVNKYGSLINADQEIIALRERIKKTAKVQLENGIISPLDYITYLNAEAQAKENLLLHQIQMLLAQYNKKITTGN